MNHLTETQLNEYLDEALSAAQQRRVEAHLSKCAACRAELKTLRGIFHTLASLPEVDLQRDLTPSVMRNASRQNIAFGWKLALAAQAGLALGLIIVFGRIFSSLFHPKLDLRPFLTAGLNLFSQFSFKFPTLDVHKFSLVTLRLPIPVSATIILLVVVVILWGVGNSKLLQNGSAVNG
jgi:predicted anti-sigma-YlaC factor YlaD